LHSGAKAVGESARSCPPVVFQAPGKEKSKSGKRRGKKELFHRPLDSSVGRARGEKKKRERSFPPLSIQDAYEKDPGSGHEGGKKGALAYCFLEQRDGGGNSRSRKCCPPPKMLGQKTLLEKKKGDNPPAQNRLEKKRKRSEVKFDNEDFWGWGS